MKHIHERQPFTHISSQSRDPIALQTSPYVQLLMELPHQALRRPNPALSGLALAASAPLELCSLHNSIIANRLLPSDYILNGTDVRSILLLHNNIKKRSFTYILLCDSSFTRALNLGFGFNYMKSNSQLQSQTVQEWRPQATQRS